MTAGSAVPAGRSEAPMSAIPPEVAHTTFWSSVWGVITTSSIVSAVITSGFKFWSQRTENAQRHAQTKLIKELESSLRRVDERSKTRFDWLHQKRAEAFVELYALLVEVHRANHRLSAMMTHGTPSNIEKIATLLEVTTIQKQFRERYTQVALLLPELIVNQLSKLDEALNDEIIRAEVYGKDQSTDDRITLAMTSQWGPISEAISKLRMELRDALEGTASEVGSA